ncbi:conserved hypothetical protein [Sporisorium reilianum SRZ2]|uniref:Uncharacterized protein n=1 Tax=Sporisorium reilianum (strain SRZ2) TaxID=999809 RepID=E6ZMD3_SPORE|nr:conserved hypothetical protein [Sporisorium reilianum SRZ2]
MPGISKKPSFSSYQTGSPHSSPHKKTVRLAENPHVSAFLSPKSRIFTGGHGYPGVPARGAGPASSTAAGAFSASASPEAFSISGKQLTPEEVAQKIASMLKPGPPFFSRVSNADLIDFISDSSIMNCDKLRAQAEALEAKKHANRATTSFVPSGTVVRRRAEEERWTGVGTVWSSLDGLPAGASFARIPGTPASQNGSTLSVKSASSASSNASGLEDDGLWNAITLSCDIDCTNVELAKSVVVPTQVLQNNNFFNGNAQSLFDDIGAGVKYKFDNLVGKASGGSGLRHKASSAALGSSSAGSKIVPNYLSLSAYTDPNSAAFSTNSFELKWPSWMPWVHKKSSSTPAADGTPASGGGDAAAGGQKRVWVPSSTKVSIHASWWGYNLYLPQPVLDAMDGDVDEAEKIANLINKCLTYILNNVPAGLPASFAAVVTILKAIAPTTGYISTFIGWSWDTIKSFNKGQGIVLSATWILPVALIPRAWDAPATPSTGAPSTPTTPTTGGTGSTVTTPSTDMPATTSPSAGTPSATTPSTDTPSATAPSTDTPSTTTPSTTTPATTTPVASSPSGTTTTTGAAAASIAAARFYARDATINDPENTPLPSKNTPAVAAPGATLPPTDPSTVDLDLAPPPTNDTSNAQYPGDARGRGGDQSTSAPMGDTPVPANRTPIDAES